MTTVHLVPHTHWDREWYRSFQTFRMQLVELVDQVLEMLEADPRFSFTLDGQLATVDDYLAIRPEAEDRIREFVSAGRLAIGPWQILMDEFLCSGETMIRNLEMGMRRAGELGAAMKVGYLPDMFGHVAQMPQLLRGVGIESAVLWRGVPAAIESHRFAWSAPDGSCVGTEYLAEGYGNAAYLFALPGRLDEKLAVLHRALRPFFGDDPLLAMYGSDHTAPRRDVMALVDELNAGDAGYEVRVDTLADYLAAGGASAGGARWHGELRSSARANMLMGVNSARIDLKQATGRAELALERYAEPMQALWGDPAAWPAAYLDLAWRRLIENSAHDSICGCSIDPVVAQVLSRYAEAEQLARGVASRAARRIAARVPGDGFAILNPSPVERRSLVELSLPIPDEWSAVAFELGNATVLPTQELERNERAVWATETSGREVSAIRRRIHGRELFGRHLVAFAVDEVDDASELTLEVDDDPTTWFDVDEMLRAVELAAEAAPDRPWRVRVVAIARRRLLVEVPVPPLGWTAVRARPAAADVDQPVRAAEGRLSNGLLTVTPAADGTLRLEVADGTVLEGVGRLVDGGDEGDSYNYAPPADDVLIEEPLRTERALQEDGPLRGVYRVLRTYRWPLGLQEGRRAGTIEVSVAMTCELRVGEPFVRLGLAFDNPSADHRLRIHVPMAREAARSAAEGQFAVVERGDEPDAGHGERPLPTYPARTFVSAGGAAVLSRHLVEYELLDERELAITVLRATGLISRNENAYREDPAGPQIATPDGQCRRPWHFELAVMPHAGGWSEAGVLEAAERYRHDLLVAPGAAPRATELPEPGTGLELTGRGVTFSSLRRRNGWLELRLSCEDAAPQEALVRGDFSEARKVDLRGDPGVGLSVSDGLLRLPLDAWQIRTVQLR